MSDSRSPYPQTLHPSRQAVPRALLGAALAAIAACGQGATTEASRPDPSEASRVTIALTVPSLDPVRDGAYEIWLLGASGSRRSLGRFADGAARSVPMPSGTWTAVEVTVEPPADADPMPSAQTLLRGELRDGRASLRLEGAVTQGALPLREAPGQFTLFSPSDNEVNGYPSHEDAGVWLFNMSPGTTAQRDYYVRVAQLQAGWQYEGWMVRDLGSPAEIWLSYGKFVPDWTGALNRADDTGWGPYSGVTDFRTARLEDFPGDDWISNPLAYPWNAALPLPLDLREKDASGRLRWSHVISIEPSRDLGEAIGTERPFVLRPYVDPVGDAGPGIARTLTLRASGLPVGTAELR